jgi:aldehyde dehydrogenase (NAD+)
LLAECLLDAGLPPAALQVVIGSGGLVGEALISNDHITAISYTGSNTVGRGVREKCAMLGKRCQVELGGQNPAVVLGDANLDLAASAVVTGAYGNAGQKCTSTRRVIVDQSIVEPFTELVVRRARELRVGAPLDPETQLGPLVDVSAVEAYEAALHRGSDEGGTRLAGEVIDDRGGFFVAPGIVASVEAGTFLAREEVFAPLLAIMPVEGFEQSVHVANDVRFGLSAAVFTRNLDLARRFIQHIRAGVVHVNSQTAGAEVHVPFGGMKESGSGFREQGRAAREFFTETKTVYQDPGQ